MSEFELEFTTSNAIKSNALVEFVAEWTPGPEEEHEELTARPAGHDKEEVDHWTLFFDGSLTLRGAGAGVLLVAPTKEELRYAVQLHFKATNNMAEYEGLITGMRIAAELGVQHLLAKGDSQLVINQVSKEYQCSDPQMAAYLAEVRRLEKNFQGFEARHIGRADNEEADALSRIASARQPTPQGTFMERLTQPSAHVPNMADSADETNSATVAGPPAFTQAGREPNREPEVLTADEQEHPWMEEILEYIKGSVLPEDDEVAERLARKAKRYALVDGLLYKRAANGVLLKCISKEQGRDVLDQIHAGECGSHMSSRTLVGKAFRLGYYWPTALADAADLVQHCKACQFHAKQTHLPAQALHTIPLSWPFAVWGMDIVGPFPRAAGGHRYLYVAIDKFTKWTEAEPVVTIDKHSAIKFMRGIVARFGVPNRLITDNGTQFTSHAFEAYCEEIGTKICYASAAHPQSNGQAERANAEILRGLKTKSFDPLKRRGAKWVLELPSVLWSIRTTVNRATGETPFFLVYGAEAVLPAEIAYGGSRVSLYDEGAQEQRRADDINLIEEHRNRAAIRNARYLQTLRRYHQKRVRPRSLETGDLVLRRALDRQGKNKLSPMWEGPFLVTKVTRGGAVRLASEDGIPERSAWNIQHLRKFYA